MIRMIPVRNRAKCKLCGDVLESFHRYDHVSCKCGEISISGGDYAFETSAKSYDNFLRVDDEGNEIIVKFKDQSHDNVQGSKPNKKDLIDSLDHMISSIENLPEHAKSHPINHYDFASALMLLRAIFLSN
jgi:hypothetical protein